MKQLRSTKRRVTVQFLRILNEDGSTKSLYEILLRQPDVPHSRFDLIHCLNPTTSTKYDPKTYLKRFTQESIPHPINPLDSDSEELDISNIDDIDITGPNENVPPHPVEVEKPVELPVIPKIIHFDIPPPPPQIQPTPEPAIPDIGPSHPTQSANRKEYITDITDAYDIPEDTPKVDEFPPNIFSDSNSLISDLPQNPFIGTSTIATIRSNESSDPQQLTEHADTLALWSELQNTFNDSFDFGSSFGNSFKPNQNESFLL